MTTTSQRKLSVPLIVFIIMFLLMALFPRLEDPDFYWHLKTGEYIVSTWSLPQYDIFTYSNYGHRWVLSEWLSQVIFYYLYRVAGFGGVGFFVALIYASCWYVNYTTCNSVLKDEGKAIVVTLLFCSFMGWVAPRPHVFTFLFFSFFIRQLFLFKYQKSERWLVFIPFGMAIWANLHGGFFIGLVLMLVFVVAEWVRLLWSGVENLDDLSRMKKISIYVALGFLATAINPDGYHYWRYPYDAIVSSGDTNIIVEWQSPDFHVLFFQYFLIMVFIFFLCMVYSIKRPDLTELSIPLIFAGGAFVSVRNLPLAALAMSPFFAVFLKGLSLKAVLLDGYRWRGPHSEEVGRLWRVLAEGNKQIGGSENAINWVLLIMSLIFIFLLYPSRKEKIDASIESHLPVKAASFILDNKIQGRMFNTYHFGGYLIFRLHPWQRVFIYGRTDIYRDGFMSEYLDMNRGKERWRELFDKNNIDYVVCESSAPLRQLLLVEGGFKMVFNDGGHSILLRDVKKYRGLIDRYAVKVG